MNSQDKVAHVLLTQGMIRDRTAKLAYDISQDYPGERLHLLCVLKVGYWGWLKVQGAHTFFSELVRQLQLLRIQFSYDFVKAKSYEGTSSTGNGMILSYCLSIVRIEGCNMESLKGRNVIIVEDIVDTGNTMSALIPYFHSYGVKSVCVQFDD